MTKLVSELTTDLPNRWSKYVREIRSYPAQFVYCSLSKGGVLIVGQNIVSASCLGGGNTGIKRSLK